MATQAAANKIGFTDTDLNTLKRLERLPFGKPQLHLLFMGGLGYTFDGMGAALVAFIMAPVMALWSLTNQQTGIVGSSVDDRVPGRRIFRRHAGGLDWTARGHDVRAGGLHSRHARGGLVAELGISVLVACRGRGRYRGGERHHRAVPLRVRPKQIPRALYRFAGRVLLVRLCVCRTPRLLRGSGPLRRVAHRPGHRIGSDRNAPLVAAVPAGISPLADATRPVGRSRASRREDGGIVCPGWQKPAAL